MARPLIRDNHGASTFWSFIGVLILSIAILGVYFGYVVPKFGTPPIRAQAGDTVQADYVGTFADDGLVFDTSFASVAKDNVSYPKAFAFTWRDTWQPLSFSVGAVPRQVIKGFDLGVQGMAVGDSKTVVVPPSMGYGVADPSKFVVKPLLESVAIRATMSVTDFEALYNLPPVSGSNVTDPFWGWPSTVAVSGSLVALTNSPFLGQIVRPYNGWDAEVVSIDDSANQGEGTILVHHLLIPDDVDRTGGKALQRGTMVPLFVVSAVDLDAGTYTLNYNVAAPYGRTLVFQVTMVSISRLF
ncbi:MAG TPA: FKBP-type peptidyl-prolyl cis-trans isomerase [Thermoplasmata archaeon]|nr:FKBP-type peptidyl-prolyl cis-trans isomerase [Thermoplasmata archaeon]